MANFFEIAIGRLIELGFYNFLLPFILFVTLFYAVLRRTKILGESEAIHGIVSVTVGLFIFGVPVILGISLTQPLTIFLTQSAVAMLVFTIGLLIASFFHPNIMEDLPNIFKLPGPATWLIWVVVGFAVLFGMFSAAGDYVDSLIGSFGVPRELFLLTVALIVIFFVFLLVAMARAGEG